MCKVYYVDELWDSMIGTQEFIILFSALTCVLESFHNKEVRKYYYSKNHNAITPYINY